ncbi:MAG TPA: heavy metal-binding domain-containing protein [Longimicrobium sp.]|nr:heavy metal-binding domain-containing protein [Longimicrobium sp.]
MLITTTSTVEGKPVKEYLGLVTGESLVGTSVFRDVAGRRAAAYEEELRKAKQIAVHTMVKEATLRGANAVIGVTLAFGTLGQDGGMLMVSASGTGVVL